MGVSLLDLTKPSATFKKLDFVSQQPPLFTSSQHGWTVKPISQSFPRQYKDVIDRPAVDNRNNGISNMMRPFFIVHMPASVKFTAG